MSKRREAKVSESGVRCSALRSGSGAGAGGTGEAPSVAIIGQPHDICIYCILILILMILIPRN